MPIKESPLPLARRHAGARSSAARACPPAGSALSCLVRRWRLGEGNSCGGMFPRTAKRSDGVRWAGFGLVVACSDEVGGAFSDHNGRRVGMAADDPGHH